MNDNRPLTIRKAVITAAGRGTRLRPATLAIQKELFPLVDRDGVAKPVIQIILEEAFASGIEEACVVVSPEDEPAFRAFLNVSGLGDAVSLAVQPSPEGSGHAIWCAREWTAGEPFLLLLGDHVYTASGETPAMAQVLCAARRRGTSVWGVQRLPEDAIGPYGIVAGIPESERALRVTRIMEKPSVAAARERLRVEGIWPHYLGIFGIYALTGAYMSCLDELVAADVRHAGELQLTSGLEMLLEREPVGAIEVMGRRYDMGNPFGLLETQIALAMRGPYRGRLLDFIEAQRSGTTEA